eukprot:gene22091-28599_t
MQPFSQPTTHPTKQPSSQPTLVPTNQPSYNPSTQSTQSPTKYSAITETNAFPKSNCSVSPASGGQLDLAVSHHGISIEFHITDNDFSKNVLKLNLAKAINRQRRILSGMELDEFDSQWGIL